MDVLFKAACLAVTAALLAVVIRKHVPEIAIVLTVCACGAVVWLAGGAFNAIVVFADDVISRVGISREYMEPLVKIAGLSIVTKLASDVCRDSGSSALASCVELTGSAICAALSLPLIMAVIELISSF